MGSQVLVVRKQPCFLLVDPAPVDAGGPAPLNLSPHTGMGQWSYV